MKIKVRPSICIFLLVSFLLSSCKLPGLIPLNSLPTMEKDADVLIEVLNGEDWIPLLVLAPEQYTEEDYSKPGTLTFSPVVTNEKPVYFSYGWCTVDEETLKQNFEHITVEISLNGDVLGSDVVHSLSFGRSDGLVCVDFGVLFSDWPPGAYTLMAVATFDEKINDGLADYAAGDYVFIYEISVNE